MKHIYLLKDVVNFVKENGGEDTKIFVILDGEKVELNNEFFIEEGCIYYKLEDFEYPCDVSGFLFDLEEEAEDEVWKESSHKKPIDNLYDCEFFVVKTQEDIHNETSHIYYVKSMQFNDGHIVLDLNVVKKDTNPVIMVATDATETEYPNEYNFIDEGKKLDGYAHCCVCLPVDCFEIYERAKTFEEANSKAKVRLKKLMNELQGMYDKL